MELIMDKIYEKKLLTDSNEVKRNWQVKIINNNNNNNNNNAGEDLNLVDCQATSNDCHNRVKSVETGENDENVPFFHEQKNNSPTGIFESINENLVIENAALDSPRDERRNIPGSENCVAISAGSNVEGDLLLKENLQKFAIISPNSNETSANNSTDNLSYFSDNYLAEEAFIVPVNNISDEEISINSDDCIYAYRGADFEPFVQNPVRDNLVDDETDFLEMDFEPDPSSEIDTNINEMNSHDQHHDLLHNHHQLQHEEIYKERENRKISHLNNRASPNLIDIPSVINIKCEEEIIHMKNKNEHRSFPENLLSLKAGDDINVNCHDTVHHNSLENEESNKKDSSVNADNSKMTGTKPKKVSNSSYSNSRICSRNQYFSSTKHNDLAEPIISTVKQSPKSLLIDRDPTEEACLDCLEKDFLSKTTGKVFEFTTCPRCKFKPILRSSHSSNEQQSIDVMFKFKEITTPTEFNEECNKKIYQRKLCDKLLINENLLKEEPKDTAKFCSKNVDERTIIQGLEKIDVSFDRDIIRNYFDIEAQRTFQDVTDFILYASKKSCNYKEIIKLIQVASKDPLQIKFTTDDTIEQPEFIQISTYDILQSWNRRNNLSRLTKLDKRFSQMNILGKVINLLRQAQQRNGKILGDFIDIPQYYRTGFITVNKK